MGRKTNSEDSIPLEKKCYHKMNLRIKSFDLPSHRLLRDSHLDLEIETLKENSRLILVLNSQFCCENSHSHSQLSLSSSQKFEKSRLNLVDFIGKFSNNSLLFLWFNHKDFNSRLSIFPPELSFSFSTLKNFIERSHSRSRLSVNLLSQKSGKKT